MRSTATTTAFAAPLPPPASRPFRPRVLRAAPHPTLPPSRRRARLVATTTPSDPASSPANPPVDSAASPDYDLLPGEIAVRFINAPDGKSHIAAAAVGDNLLRVGDSVNLHIPRGCQTGVCGTCTCDILDPNEPSGRQTVRACQTSVTALGGANELVVDVERMRSTRSMKNALARFENLDTEYVPRAVPRGRGSVTRVADCAACATRGLVQCDACEGVGEDGGFVCALCAGTGALRCGDCQGTGEVTLRKR